MSKNNPNYYLQTFRQQRTNKIKIISLNNDHRYLSAESMLSQKRGYKVNFIYTCLGLVFEAKYLVDIITNRLLDNQRLVEIRLFNYTVNTE